MKTQLHNLEDNLKDLGSFYSVRGRKQARRIMKPLCVPG